MRLGEPGRNRSNWSLRDWLGCTAFDVITVLRQKYHQKVTGYEVRVEADQADRPPQVFTAVRIHHVVTGFDIDMAALREAIRLSEEKYCSVGAMLQKTASFHTTHEIVEERTEWMKPAVEAMPVLGIVVQHPLQVNGDGSHSAGRARRSNMTISHLFCLPEGFTKLPVFFIRMLRIALPAGMLMGFSAFASPQPAADISPLTLQQAVKIALEKNPLRKVALADTRVRSRRYSGIAICAYAAADTLRDCYPRRRPGLRFWQQVATAALYVCRFRTECG